MGEFLQRLLSDATAGATEAPTAGPAHLLAQLGGERTPLQNALIVGGILLVGFLLVLLGRRRRSAARGVELQMTAGHTHPSGRAGGRGARDRKSAVPGAAGDLESILLQIQETGREIESRLDTKIRYAQAMLRESQETLADVDTARARLDARIEQALELAGERPGAPTESAPTQDSPATDVSISQAAAAAAAELTRSQLRAREVTQGTEAPGARSPETTATVPTQPKKDSPWSPVIDATDREILEAAAQSLEGTRADTGAATDEGIPKQHAPGMREPVLSEGPPDEPGGPGEPEKKQGAIPMTEEKTELYVPGIHRKRPPLGAEADWHGGTATEQESQARIRRLATEGLTAREIAKAVNRPVGEIELILALGRGEDSANTP